MLFSNRTNHLDRNRRISIRMTDEEAAALAAGAKELGKTPHSLIRTLLRQALFHKKSPLPVLAKNRPKK